MNMLLILVASLLASSSSFAGSEAGNGGDVVICKANANKPIQLLDHYEATDLQGFQLDLGASNLGYMQKVEFVLKKIERLNPSRANLYRKWASEFLADSNFVNGQLIPIPDVGPGVIPAGCDLVQIAIQQTPELPGEKRFLIQKDLWDQLDEAGKAGLVLHELIYREALKKDLPAKNSKLVRYFNGVISSTQIDQMALKTYIELVHLIDLQTADAQDGMPFLFYEDQRGTGQRTDYTYRYKDDSNLEYVQRAHLWEKENWVSPYYWRSWFGNKVLTRGGSSRYFAPYEPIWLGDYLGQTIKFNLGKIGITLVNNDAYSRVMYDSSVANGYIPAGGYSEVFTALFLGINVVKGADQWNCDSLVWSMSGRKLWCGKLHGGAITEFIPIDFD